MKSTRPSVRDFPKRSAANKSRSGAVVSAAVSAAVTTASSSPNESLISTMLSPVSALEPATGTPDMLPRVQPAVEFESLLSVPLPETSAVPLWSGDGIGDGPAGKLNGLGLDWNGTLGTDASFTYIGDIPMVPGLPGLGVGVSNSYMSGPTRNMGYAPSIPPTATQRKPPEVVHGIVQEAVNDFQQFPMNDVVFRCRKRRALSELFDSSFGGLDAPKSASHVLHSFVTCFFDEFHHMWPILWRQGLDYDAVEPLLYLTMTSIGAIYAGTSRAKAYGMSMLHSLKAAVVNACLACPEHETKLDQIFEALLLLAIASLHLGHARTPKYIHQARAVLASHARRVNLFSETPESPHDGEESLTRWIKMERKRRMAFAFLRWEAISSILLNTSPQLSCEELCLKIPCNQELWLYVGPDWRERLLTARQEAAFHPMYAELFWHLHGGGGTGSLALTPLSAPIHELMLYGLHLPLGTTPLHSQHTLRSPDWESVRRMLNPISLYDRENLSAWLLYHLAYIRIHSNMNLFKIPSTGSEDPTAGPFQQQRINDLTCWSTTTSAKVALHHACQIWYLITATLQQDDLVTPYFPNQRAASQHNIVAIICLYYAGIVMRTMADLCPSIDAQILQPRHMHIMGETLLTSYNIHGEVQKLGDIASRLCPSSEETSWLVTEIKALSLGGWFGAASSQAVDIWEP